MRTIHAPHLGSPQAIAHGDFTLVVRRLADDIAAGADASRLVGSGIEYAESRPYQPGDPIRRLDWRVSARRGTPYTRQYEALKRITVFLVVDTSASMAVQSGETSKLDAAVWIASGLGLLAQRRLSPVAVVSAGDREDAIRPSLSRGDLWLALEPLRRHQLDESTDLARALTRIDARAGTASLIVAISDFHDPGAVAALRRAAAVHDTAAIHLVDPVELAHAGVGFLAAREAETGRAFLASGSEARASLDRARDEFLRAGCDYLRLQTNESIAPPLRAFLSRRGGLQRSAR